MTQALSEEIDDLFEDETDQFSAIWLPKQRGIQEGFYALFVGDLPTNVEIFADSSDLFTYTDGTLFCSEWQVLVLSIKHISE
jgi:hypothetical protein